MKRLARPKLNGTVTVRRLHPPQLESTAPIRKGELVEPLVDVARRVGLHAPSAGGRNGSEDSLCLVDDQELAVFSKLCDGGVYFITGGVLVTDAAAGVSAVRAEAVARLPPDAAVAWAFDERTLLHQPMDHRSPETPYRVERAVDKLRGCVRAAEILPRPILRTAQSPDASNVAAFVPPRLATAAEVFAFHSASVYGAFIASGAALPSLPSDVYCNEGTSSTAARLSAAAVIDAAAMTLKAVDAARSSDDAERCRTAPLLAFCLVRPPGHHCTADRPSGFCLVNNVAIAATQVLRQPHRRVAIVDLDVHFGEGTAAFVENHRSATEAFPLLYLSLHRFDDGRFYPFDATGATEATGARHPRSVVNVAVNTRAHVPAHCEEVISDYLMEDVVARVFVPRLAAFRPDVVFVSLGFDAGYGDPLGKMSVEGGFAAAIRVLKQWCLHGSAADDAPRHAPTGLVVVLEGGYNPETVANGALAVAHALTFPAADADVRALADPQVPRVWADLRQRQQRRQREWARARGEQESANPAAATRPPTKEESDDCEGEDRPGDVASDVTLLERHREWCARVVEAARAVHFPAGVAE